MIVPLDIDEDGKIDVIVQSVDPITGFSSLKIYYNNQAIDAFFIKAMMILNKASIISGATLRFIVTTLEAENVVSRVAAQLPTDSYNSL